MPADSNTSGARRRASNERLVREEEDLHEPEARTPHRAAEQSSPEPERPTTPDEDAEQDLANLENPPQAEGARERSNDAV